MFLTEWFTVLVLDIDNMYHCDKTQHIGEGKIYHSCLFSLLVPVVVVVYLYVRYRRRTPPGGPRCRGGAGTSRSQTGQPSLYLEKRNLKCPFLCHKLLLFAKFFFIFLFAKYGFNSKAKKKGYIVTS